MLRNLQKAATRKNLAVAPSQTIDPNLSNDDGL